MPRRLRPSDAVALLLAVAGVVLAVQAWRAGSLFRYVLAGGVTGVLLCVPFVSILVLRERARRFWRRMLFALVPCIAVLLLVELGLRLFGPARELPARLRADARLGHVLEPGSEGTDEHGFRNATVPVRTDVLIVGDSQTWGFQIERAETFTAVFAATTGASSYQMANGSYGPVQYRELVRQGLSLQPRLVVVAFYFGNDFVDAFDYAGLEGAEPVRSGGVQYGVRDHPEFEGPQSPNWTMALVDGVLDVSRVLDAAANVVKSRLQGGCSTMSPVPCTSLTAARPPCCCRTTGGRSSTLTTIECAGAWTSAGAASPTSCSAAGRSARGACCSRSRPKSSATRSGRSGRVPHWRSCRPCTRPRPRHGENCSR